MAYHIYSSEALPNPKFLGKPRYTPDASYIRWGGIALPFVPEKQWMKLADSFTTVQRSDWKDRQGKEVEISIRKFMPVVTSQFAELGVIMLDHEPDEKEKAALEPVSRDLNLKWRKKQIEFFESQRDMAKARQGVYDPSPYVDECYEVLKMEKPYSVDALQALRDPGASAADRIATAITDSMKAARKESADQLAHLLTQKTEPPKGAPVRT
jgi:hypothetical protein